MPTSRAFPGSPLALTLASLVTASLLGGGLLLGAAAPARADSGTSPSPAAPSPSAAASAGGVRTLCRLTDQRLPELSGLVVSDDRMLAMNDGGDKLTVYALDTGCRVIAVRSADVDPYDPEDLAVGADGTVWFADTGDNRAERATVALLAMRPNGSTGVYRMTYPDGPHDAESLLLAPDGTPYVVTKEVLGASGVYRPAAPLADGATVPLRRTGGVAFTPTGTPGGPVGEVGQLLATGGAVSRDGRFLALRTYTDAYVWPLTGSDVPAALARTPTRIALPAAPQGEAVSFTADGRSLVVAGEVLPNDVTVVPLPASLLDRSPGTTAAADGSSTGRGGGAGVSALTAGITAVCVATVVVWLAGLIGRLRRRGGSSAPKG